ncbi:hypothetical protein [Pseudomonas fluorescens]|uniref:Uncharacterized protein n=1 Tax=Pseudomonas fluorescens TaxID=294 RepID=A0A5E7ERS0_PSEFL|nr:hypothetical protein [Pseudomonas fluorescens]VVO29565.1 hypothetical protein PS691_04830 [Pseudomonas fluorescens]
MAPVDRPQPVNYQHPNGREATIDFEWADSGNPIPTGLRITVKHSADYVQNLHEVAKYKSFDDAKNQGIKLAKNMIEQADRL